MNPLGAGQATCDIPARLAPMFTLALLLLTPVPNDLPDVEPGLTLRVYEVATELRDLPEMVANQTPNLDRVVEALDLSKAEFADLPAPIVSHVTGWIQVEEAGEYVFRLTSDDGSRLSIDGAVVVDHDGQHGATAKVGEARTLSAGRHALFLEHFDSGGARSLKLEWKPAGTGNFELVAGDVLTTEKDLTRVTSPGPKRIVQIGRPGDLLPLDGVHPSYAVETIRPEGFEPKIGAMAFLPDGRLAFGTFDPLQRDDRVLPDIDSKEPDTIYALDVNTGELTEIGTDVYEPSGMCVVDGEMYVAHRKAITKLTDLDGDGFLETHTEIGAGWEGWNYHQFAFCLVHRDGKLYCALSTTMAPPGWEGMQTNAGPNGPMRGGFLEVDIETGNTRVIAGGARTPNGLGMLADGTLLYVDNQGAWMPASVLAEVVPGRFYGHYNWTNPVTKLLERFPDGGHPSVYCDRPRTPPALWLPQNEIVNSPTEIQLIESGPFEGQILIGELTGGGIRRAALERVDGVLQGAVFRFTQGFEAGINRMRFGPDGALYVGGMGAAGNWKWRDTQFGLQRLVPTGGKALEFSTVMATPNGLELGFTGWNEWLGETDRYEVTSWTYAPTGEYGGPKVDVRKHVVMVGPQTYIQDFDVEPAPYEVTVDQVLGSTIHLQIDKFEPGRCYHIRVVEPDSEEGASPFLWSTECWYTLNRIPAGRPTGIGVGILPPANAVSLVSSAFPMSMRHKNDKVANPQHTQDDLLAANPYTEVGFGSGDLVSTTEFGDARVHLEWYCPPGGEGQGAGNSGVYFQQRYELQVLGSAPAPNEPKLNEAGAIYNIKVPDVNASTGPGTWQAYDVWFTAPRFAAGKKIANARITAYWNGVLIHDDVEVKTPTGSAASGGEEAGPDGVTQIGPLRFQDHGSDAEGPVRYRNVWITPLDERDDTAGPWIDLLATGDWSERGGEADFDLADGLLKGETRPDTPNTFWTSHDTYGDFELTWESKVHPELNSGVQIRSHVLGGFDERDGGLVGYQVECDPSARAYSAGIYDERRRGWLHDLGSAPYARRAFRQGEWNSFRVVAQGPVIRTWINGIPAAEIFDAMDTEGHIGFQVHGVGGREDALDVQWRNVRLRRYGAR